MENSQNTIVESDKNITYCTETPLILIKNIIKAKNYLIKLISLTTHIRIPIVVKYNIKQLININIET